MQLNLYLTFNGNCREAMGFYQACLGGELILQTVNESPLAAQLPKKLRAFILQSILKTESFMMMGSDMTNETSLVKGNANAMLLNCGSEEEIKRIFNALSKDGKINQPLETTHWGALFGDLTDKFGNHWLLNFDKNNRLI